MTTKEELIEHLDNSSTNKIVDRLHKFVYIHDTFSQKLGLDALTEDWGIDNFALEKYLAVQIPWSIEQGLFTVSDTQWYISAGNLQTRYGTPLGKSIQKQNSRLILERKMYNFNSLSKLLNN